MPDGSIPEQSAGPAQNAGGMVTLPNVITFGRLCAVPLAVWLVLRQDMQGAFILFVLAGLSDAVDGWLARHRGAGSAIGAALDPVADKALLVSMYVTLAGVGVLPDFVAILVVFRDLVIVGGVLVLAVLGHPVAIRPIFISKINTVLQIVLVAVALLLTGFDLTNPKPEQDLLWLLIWAVTASTLISGAAYVWKAARRPLPAS
jgi:cardiolipin synthase (CMP-forming)